MAARTGPTHPYAKQSAVFGILAGYADQNDHDTLRTEHAHNDEK